MSVTQGFVVTDDQFVVQTLRDAYEDLRQSKDPAVQYYIRPLTYLPEGSQRLNPDAVPEIEWRNHDKTRGRVRNTYNGTTHSKVLYYSTAWPTRTLVGLLTPGCHHSWIITLGSPESGKRVTL